MTVKTVLPEARHRAFRDDLLALLREYAGELEATEMLALSAHIVGQIIALQDQRTMTSTLAMEIVAHNIIQGNIEAMAELVGKPAGTA